VFGHWKSAYTSFRRWTKSGLREALLIAVSAPARDEEYLMIDSTSLRVHQHASGPAAGQLAQAMGRSKASLSTKMHFATHWAIPSASSSPGRLRLDQAKPLLTAHLKAGSHAIMDKGDDSDAIRAYVNQLGGVAVIALHPGRSPVFDQHLYRERYRIENLFARLKHYRRIATRYEKPHATFAAMLSEHRGYTTFQKAECSAVGCARRRR
jgi:transposase